MLEGYVRVMPGPSPLERVMTAVLKSIPRSSLVMAQDVYAEVRAMAPFLEHLLIEHGISGANVDIAMAALLSRDHYFPNDILNDRAGLRPAQTYIIDRAVRLARANEWWCESFNKALCDLLGVSRHEDGSAIRAVDWYDSDGYNCKGVNRSGYSKDGYDSNDRDRDGYDRHDVRIDGVSRETWARGRIDSIVGGVRDQRSYEALIRELERQMEVRLPRKEEKRS